MDGRHQQLFARRKRQSPNREAVALIGARIDLLNAHLRDRVARLGADPVSQGILIGIEEAFEKHAWMLRVQLR